MRMLLMEMKKIWNPGILAVLLLVGGLYFFCFPSFYIRYFCNGPYAQTEFDQLTQLSLLPDFFETNTSEYAATMAVWIVLGNVLLLSPTLVRDRLCRTRAMQWASCIGRKTILFQTAAGLISSLAFTAISIAAYTLPFFSQGIAVFLDCPISHTIVLDHALFDFTYGQYLMILALAALGLGAAAGAFTLFLSRFSASYIAMLLKAIPLFILLGCIYGYWLFNGLFYIRPFYTSFDIFIPKGADGISLFIVLILGLGLCLGAGIRQKKQEIL